MAEPRELSCYEYVTVPYGKVREALRADARGIFERATATAATRARDLVGSLHVNIGGLQIGADISIDVRRVTEEVSALGERSTKVELGWTAAKNAGLFPAMDATLTIYPLSREETQLDLLGRYTPPLGAVGNAIDALVGHRIAQASVLRFVQEVAARLVAELGS